MHSASGKLRHSSMQPEALVEEHERGRVGVGRGAACTAPSQRPRSRRSGSWRNTSPGGLALIRWGGRSRVTRVVSSSSCRGGRPLASMVNASRPTVPGSGGGAPGPAQTFSPR